MEYTKEIIQITEKLNSLQSLYEQVNGQVQHAQMWFIGALSLIVAFIGGVGSIAISNTIKELV